MNNPEETVTLKKSDLITKMLFFEKCLAWQDYVLSRLCLDLSLVRSEVHTLVFAPDVIQAKSDLVDYLFPNNEFVPLLTDELYDGWKEEFEQRKTPISNNDKDFYRIGLRIPCLPNSLGVEADRETPH